MEARGQSQLLYLRGHSPCALRQGLSVTWSLSIRLGWLTRPRDLLVCAFPVLGLHTRPPYLSFSHGCWGLNTGPHICITHTLPSEPVPHCSRPLKSGKVFLKSKPQGLEHGLQEQPPSPHGPSSCTQWAEAPWQGHREDPVCQHTLGPWLLLCESHTGGWPGL